MSRHFVLVALIGTLFVGTSLLTSQARPSGWQNYDNAAFMMDQKKGRTIVVRVVADNCTDCREVGPALDRLLAEVDLVDASFVQVDFDGESGFADAHRVDSPPTILVFDGMDEIARVDGSTGLAELRGVVLGSR